MRATFGNFSGPMTMSATTPITASLVRPRSIIRYQPWPDGTRSCGGVPIPSQLAFLFRVDVDGAVVDHLRRRGGRRCRSGGGRRRLVIVTAHAILEALDGLADVGTHVADFLGAEHQHDDDQQDQPVPDTH